MGLAAPRLTALDIASPSRVNRHPRSPMNRLSPRLATVPLLFATACVAATAPESSDPQWTGSIEVRNGVTYVENPASGLWDGVSEPLEFELEQLFGADPAPEEAVLGSIVGLVIDNDRNVHVYDGEASQFVSFAPDGSVTRRSGGPGDGPGQFNDVRGIAFDGADTIYVLNQAGVQLDLWGTDGRYRSTFTLQESGIPRAWMGGYLSGDRLALMTTVFETAANDYVILDVGQPMTVATRFRVSSIPEIKMPPGFIFQVSHYFHGDQIFVGGWERYMLRAYDAAGTLQRQVTRPVTYLRRPGFAAAGAATRGTSYGGLSAPVVLDTGHWVVFAAWPNNVDDPNAFTALEPQDRPPIAWSSSLDLFDPEGRFLASRLSPDTPLPDIGRPWTVGPSGALYTVHSEPFPQVRRYRLHLNGPQSSETRE